MVESYLRQSALAHLGLLARAAHAPGEAQVTMAERQFRGIVNLRGKPQDDGFMAAFEGAFGFRLPVEPNTTWSNGDVTAFWLGPDEWWIVAPVDGPDTAATLRQALEGRFCAVTDVSESRTCIAVAGPRARDLLAKGCPLDLHPRVFRMGLCAQSHLAKADIVLHQVGEEPVFDLYVLRSFAEYLWLWLEDAAQEYGMAVAAD